MFVLGVAGDKREEYSSSGVGDSYHGTGGEGYRGGGGGRGGERGYGGRSMDMDDYNSDNT